MVVVMEKRKYVGKTSYLSDNYDIAEEYKKIYKEDKSVATLLAKEEKYNQALYFLIQATEKYIKYAICCKVNVTQVYFAEHLRSMGHSFDKSIDFLIDCFSGNDSNLKEVISKQFKVDILDNIRFSGLHNDIRYPSYIKKTNSYRTVTISKQDYYNIDEKFNVLIAAIEDLNKFSRLN